MNLLEHLAVPYVLTAEAARSDEGRWVRRASYPELGCSADADTLEEAMAALDEEKTRVIVDRLATGTPLPVPRPPLRSLMAVLRPGVLEDAEARLRAARLAGR